MLYSSEVANVINCEKNRLAELNERYEKICCYLHTESTIENLKHDIEKTALRNEIAYIEVNIQNWANIYSDQLEKEQVGGMVQTNQISQEETEMNTTEVRMLSGEFNLLTDEQIEDNGYIYECVDCGEMVEVESYVESDSNDKVLCNDCRDNGSEYELCSSCNTYEYDCVFTEDTNEFYCNDCLHRIYCCDDCGTYYVNWSSIHTDNSNNVICNGCWDNGNYFHCDDCENIVDYDDAVSTSNGTYCSSCYEYNDHCEDDREDLSNWVHEYDYVPYMHFLGDDSTHAFRIGMELEIMGGNGYDFCTETENIQDIYLKNDGSLDDTGIEIVTYPMSIGYFMNDLSLTEILNTARSNSFTSHDNGSCGFHVHVDRNSLGKNTIDQKYTIAKLLLLFERFFDEKLVKFSRRNSEQLNHWCKKSYINYDKNEDTVGVLYEKISEKERYEGRYQAINLQNRNTIEFRIFRGSLKEQTIRAAVQFCEVLTNYAKNNDINKIQVCTWDEAIRSDYKDLNAYLELKGLIDIKPEIEEVPEVVEELKITEEVERDANGFSISYNPYDLLTQGSLAQAI